MPGGGADQMWGLDFETYSDVDLKEHGLDRYIASPNFRVLVACVKGQNGSSDKTWDFVHGPMPWTLDHFKKFMSDGLKLFVAHNAGFERAVLRRLGIFIDDQILDSAVLARCLGASSSLEFAAPQLLPHGVKMPEGKALIQQFSVPQKRKDGSTFAYVDTPSQWLPHMQQDWTTFIEYCMTDAALGINLWMRWNHLVQAKEHRFERLTQSMNQVGWKIDIELVKEMKRRYDANVEDLLEKFQIRFDPTGDLNFNSPQQLARWCRERGVRVKSLDKEHLPKILNQVTSETDRLNKIPIRGRTSAQQGKLENLRAVQAMLSTKFEMAGSSLKKLSTILDLVGPDRRLHNQYMHCGAGQSHRTSGRGAQLQNVKRLNGEPNDVSELVDGGPWWSNDKLASNLRQVFTAGKWDGELIVADFKAVEARVLAWLADQQWKLDAFADGKDLYRVMAAEMYHTTYDRIAPKGPERTTGKVGELSCGYGAGPGAVQKFARKMGVTFTDDQSVKTVNDWRAVNDHIVKLWDTLDSRLRELVTDNSITRTSALLRPGRNGDAVEVVFQVIDRPTSLGRILPQARTIKMVLTYVGTGNVLLSRVFQGVHMVGRDMCYVKPSETKSGPEWKQKWYKDGKSGYYKLYGGKIAGILTQSLAREIFMDACKEIHGELKAYPDVNLMGQFHDELVVEWLPNDHLTLTQTMAIIETEMIGEPLPGLPIDATVAHAYRYIK